MPELPVMTLLPNWTRSRYVRGCLTTVLLGALLALPVLDASATCNLVPAAARNLPSTLGIVGQPIAAPGDTVTLRVNQVCDGGAIEFDPDPVDNAVTLHFEPPAAGGAPGPITQVVVPSGQVEVLCDNGMLECRELRFTLPDTDADLAPDGDGLGLTGPARIEVRVGGQPAIDIGPLFLPTGGCDREDEGLFQHFTVLPPYNDFAAVADGSETRILATLDGGGNLLIPFDYAGIVPAGAGAVFRVIEATADIEAFTGGDPLRLPERDAVRAFTPRGSPIPPVLRVGGEGASADRLIFGTVDTARGVLRIDRFNPDPIRFPGFPSPLHDFRDRLADGRGPVLLDEGLSAGVRELAPLASLNPGTEALGFAAREEQFPCQFDFSGPAPGTVELDLNTDGDSCDQVVQVLDTKSGGNLNTGHAVVEVSWEGFDKPAIATEGAVVAFLESEMRNGSLDRTNDFDVEDSILRVFDASGAERTTTVVTADPLPAVNGRPLVVDSGRVFFRTRERDGLPRRSRALTPLFNTQNHLTEGGGRYMTFLESIIDQLYWLDRDPDGDGIRDDGIRLERINVRPDGQLGDEIPQGNAAPMSADGRHVAFVSFASDLVDVPMGNLFRQVYVRDMETSQTFHVSRSTTDGPGNGQNGSGVLEGRPGFGISADGRYVVYHTDAKNLAGYPQPDDFFFVVVYDRDLSGDGVFDEEGDAGIVHVVDSAASVLYPVISGDGSHIAYHTLGTDLGFGIAPDLVVERIGGARYRLPTTDGLTPSFPTAARDWRLDFDGGVLSFTHSASNLVPGVSGRQLYFWDVRRGAVEVASEPQQPISGGNLDAPEISGDGRFAVFGDLKLLYPEFNESRQWRFDRVTDTLSWLDVDDADGSRVFSNSATAVSSDDRAQLFHRTVPSQAIWMRETVVDADEDGFPDPGISLNPGDPDPFDTVLQVFDANTGMLRPTANLPARVVSVASGRAAILSPEDEAGEMDGNGDADIRDAIVKVYDSETDQAIDLGISGHALDLSESILCIAVSEADEGGVDLSADGDSDDAVLALWTTGSPAQALVLTNVSVARDGEQRTLAALDGRCAVLADEADDGPAGTDRNGDGDASDRVIRIVDAAGQLVPLVDAAGDPLPATLAAADLTVGPSGAMAAFRVCEAEQGDGPLNDDGDLDECVMHVLDLGGAGPRPVNTGLAAEPCTFPACDPFFEPFRVRGFTVSFVARESAHRSAGGGPSDRCIPISGDPDGCDFTGDGDDDDLVIQSYSLRADRGQAFAVSEEFPPVSVAPFPEGSVEDETVLYLEVPESLVGEDVNGDGMITDDLVLVFVGDRDGDGSFDEALSNPDNCGEAVNDDQADLDADGLGNVCDPDRDGDGVPDDDDNCIADFNPLQQDADGDLLGNACDGDLNQDGFVGGPDFDVFLQCFNQAVGPDVGPADDPTCEESDMNGDGFVGGPDFDLFLKHFNQPAVFGEPGGCGLGWEIALAIAALAAVRRQSSSASRILASTL